MSTLAIDNTNTQRGNFNSHQFNKKAIERVAKTAYVGACILGGGAAGATLGAAAGGIPTEGIGVLPGAGIGLLAGGGAGLIFGLLTVQCVFNCCNFDRSFAKQTPEVQEEIMEALTDATNARAEVTGEDPYIEDITNLPIIVPDEPKAIGETRIIGKNALQNLQLSQDARTTLEVLDSDRAKIAKKTIKFGIKVIFDDNTKSEKQQWEEIYDLMDMVCPKELVNLFPDPK